jgi:hypothetical protein
VRRWQDLAALVAALTLAGCGLFASKAARPATYGAALAACVAASPPGPKGWATFDPCCRAAAARFDRPPTDCQDGAR